MYLNLIPLKFIKYQDKTKIPFNGIKQLNLDFIEKDESIEESKESPLTKKVKLNKSEAKLAEILIEWRKQKQIPELYLDESAKLIKSQDISKIKLTDYAKDIQALFINICWKTKQNSNGKSVQDLERIRFEELGFINNGIIFIWTEKEHLSKIMDVMEEKKFQYIENFVCIELNKQIAESIVNQTQIQKNDKKTNKITNFFSKKQQSTENSVQEDMDIYNLFSKVDAIQIFNQIDYSYFKKTKKVLMMFRKFGKDQLELRHQRTSDAIFNVASPIGSYDEYLMEYAYNLIETLLPKAKYNKQQGFKMVQLYGNKPRKDWIIIQE